MEIKMSINALFLYLSLDQFVPLYFFQVTKIGLINTIFVLCSENS